MDNVIVESKSKYYNFYKYAKFTGIIFFIVWLLISALLFSTNTNIQTNWIDMYGSYVSQKMIRSVCISIGVSVICAFVAKHMMTAKIIVTKEKLKGMALGFRTFDVPWPSVLEVAYNKEDSDKITIKTVNSEYELYYLKNANEIYRTIKQILDERV